MDPQKTFLDVVRNRKSIRSFGPDGVDPSVVRRILELATNAPTNCNQQAWNFIVVTDAATKERLVTEAASNTNIRRAPVVVVVTYDGWNFKEAIQGASLAVGHMLLAAEYYGLGALPMNSYGADSGVKYILGIPDTERICCFVLLGYPDTRAEKATKVPRKPLAEALHEGAFGHSRRPPFVYDPDRWTLETLRYHQRYYCRKTSLGKEMDIMSGHERVLVKRELSGMRFPALDLCSYDGSFIREFPHGPLHTVDLTEETAAYTLAAVEQQAPHTLPLLTNTVYDEHAPRLFPGAVQTVTMIYRLERLPSDVRKALFTKTYATLERGGELIIIARHANVFLKIFFTAVKWYFGPDVRTTGIYAFFGPYRPIRIFQTVGELRRAGFSTIAWSGYFPIPTFYEQVCQLFLQYRKSEGSSYLHREIRSTVISRLLSRLLAFQGFLRAGVCGSVVVIRCKK